MTNPNSKNNLTVLLVLLLVVILGGGLLIYKLTATHSKPSPTAQQEISVPQPLSTEPVSNQTETPENQTPDNASAAADQPVPAFVQTMIDMQEKVAQQPAIKAILHQNNLSFDKNARGSKLMSMRTTRSSDSCAVFQPHRDYQHPSCLLLTYADRTSSNVLFDQQILRERIDYQADGTPVRKIIFHPNGQPETIELYPHANEIQQVTYTAEGIFNSQIVRVNKQITQMIVFSVFKTAPTIPPLQYAVSVGENQTQVYALKKSAYPTFTYQKQLVTPSSRQDLGLVSGQMDAQGRVSLSDQTVLPARTHWQAAPAYCKIYPYDCITQ